MIIRRARYCAGEGALTRLGCHPNHICAMYLQEFTLLPYNIRGHVTSAVLTREEILA